MTDIFTKKKRSEIMSKVRGKDTKIELKMRKAVRKMGLKGYKLNCDLPGKPDIAFPEFKVAIFCDGEFWHGRYFDMVKHKYMKFWKEKIRQNMARDKKVDKILRKAGWIVIRLWEKDIEKNVDACARKIMKALKKRGYRI